jgi:hypothetical protein
MPAGSRVKATAIPMTSRAATRAKATPEEPEELERPQTTRAERAELAQATTQKAMASVGRADRG